MPTARFAEPIGSLLLYPILLYPILALSGLFVAIESMPAALQTIAHVLP